MDVQLKFEFMMAKPTKPYVNPVNERVAKMKRLIYKYKEVRCRDIEEYALGVKPFEELRMQFQVGHLPTLRYISFHRRLVNPTPEWIRGFIEAANNLKEQYDNHVFQE